MKATSFLLVLAAFCFPGILAAQDPTALVTSLPACGLECLVTSVTASNCSLTNTTCVCTNSELQAKISACVLSSCTIRQALVIQNVTGELCHAPVRDKTASFQAVLIGMGVFSGIMVALRLLTCYLVGGKLYSDDYAILGTLLSGIPNTVLLAHYLPKNGIGKDIWHVPFDQITNFVKIFYIAEIMYFAHISLLKIALLLFYRRIFSRSKVVKYIDGTIVLNILVGFAFLLVGLFQCKPIKQNWERWDGEHEGQCSNINAITWANSALSILIDVWMIALPMSQLASLQLHWKKKIGVGLMFMVGTFVTIISILRLRTLVLFGSSQNPTWDNYEPGVWSGLEVNIGIICTCMPSLRLLLMRMMPKVFGGSSASRGTAYAKSYANTNDRSQFGTRKTGARRLDDDDAEILRDSSENVEMSRRGSPTPTSQRDTKIGFKVQQQDVG